MPTVPVPSLAATASIADLVNSKPGDVVDAGHFLSLLDIAGTHADPANANTRTNDTAASSRNDDSDRRRDDVPAVPQDAPAQPAAQRNASDDAPRETREVAPLRRDDRSDDKNPPADKTNNSDKTVSRDDASASSHDDTHNAPLTAAPDHAGKPVKVKASAKGDADDAQSTQDIQDALGKQLNHIEQILTTVIQALTSAAEATASGAASSTDGVSTAAAPSTVTDLTSSQVAAVLLPSASITTATDGKAPVASADEIGLLKDIRSLLQQMQAVLAAGGKDALPDNAAQAATDNLAARQDGQQQDLLSLADALQKDVNQLTQLLAAQSQGSVNATDTSAPSTTGSDLLTQLQPVSTDNTDSSAADLAAQLAALDTSGDTLDEADLASFIRDSIADVRGTLQQLRQENNSALRQLQNDILAQFAEARQFYKNDGGTAAGASTTALPLSGNAPDGSLAANADTLSGALRLGDDKSSSPADKNPLWQSSSLTNSDAPVINVPVSVTSVSSPSASSSTIQVGGAQSGNSSGNSDAGYNNQGQSLTSLSNPSGSGQSQSANASSNASFSRVLEQQSAPPVMEQVTLHIKSALGDGSSHIRIQLDPADLGKLDIRIHVGADGKTGVVITADNGNTLDMLQRDSQGLARALSDAGLKTDSGSLSFNLRGGQQEQGQGGNQQAAGSYQKMQPEEDEDLNINVLTRSYVVNMSDGLDIKI